MTDFGERVGIALLPFDGLEVARSEPMVKTETFPEADNVDSSRSDRDSGDGGWGRWREEGWGDRGSAGEEVVRRKDLKAMLYDTGKSRIVKIRGICMQREADV